MISCVKRANCYSYLKSFNQSFIKKLGSCNHHISSKFSGIVVQSVREFTSERDKFQYTSPCCLKFSPSIREFSQECASISMFGQISNILSRSYSSYLGSYPRYEAYREELKDLYSLMGDCLNRSTLKVIEPGDFDHWCNLVPESKRSYIKDYMVCERIVVSDTRDMYPDTWNIDSNPEPSGLKHPVLVANPELPKLEWVNAYVNGSYAPAPQDSGVGVVFVHPSRDFETHGERVGGKTSFEVELKAIRIALRVGRSKGFKKICVISGCKGSVDAAKGIKSVNKELYGNTISKIRKLKQDFEAVDCEFMQQVGNKASKALANLARLGPPVENGPEVDEDIRRLVDEVPCFKFDWVNVRRRSLRC